MEEVDIKPTPVLTYVELDAYSSVNSICCFDSSRQFTLQKEDKIDPTEMVKARESLERCFLNTFSGIKNSCNSQYDDVTACLSDNPRSKSKCAAVRSALEECAGKNRLGELAGL